MKLTKGILPIVTLITLCATALGADQLSLIAKAQPKGQSNWEFIALCHHTTTNSETFRLCVTTNNVLCYQAAPAGSTNWTTFAFIGIQNASRYQAFKLEITR